MNPQNKKFLIIKLSALGDVTHTLPVLSALRKNHPHAFIAWMVEDRYQDLLTGNPDIDLLIPIRTKYWRKNINFKTLSAVVGIIADLRKHRFDTVFDFHGLIKSGLIAFLSGSPDRVGFPARECKEPLSAWFTTRKGPAAKPGAHVVDRYLSLIGVEVPENTAEFPIPLPEEAERSVTHFFDTHPDLTAKPVIGINPGAGFESKLWNLDRFTALADRITSELSCAVLLTWGPGEEAKVRHIQEQARLQCWIAPPTSIIESAALYRRMALLISCDSGPLHLGAALGVPTVSIFGPTDPARNGPYGNKHAVICKTLSCSFCWKRKCPLQTRECMESVTTDEVFDAVKKSFTDHVKVIAS